MNDEQLSRLLGSLQTTDLPDPAFAEALFERLEAEVDRHRGGRYSRPVWVLVAAALLLAALLGVALAVGSGLLKLPVVSVVSPSPSPSASATPSVSPEATVTPAALPAVYQTRGQQITDLWAGANGSGAALVIVGEATTPGPGWPPANGSDAKIALLAGNVVAAAPLPTEAPAPADVLWNDGSSATLPLVSAAQALSDLRAGAEMDCGSCKPLIVDEATLTTMTAMTTHGEATVPAWLFHLQGSDASVLRVAVDAEAHLPSGASTVPDDPTLVMVDSADGNADSRELTVHFVGAGGTSDQVCGADYAAFAFESEHAVVVFVVLVRQATLPPGVDGCLAIGYGRTATLTLASPLGDRTVLDGRRGEPIPVTDA